MWITLWSLLLFGYAVHMTVRQVEEEWIKLHVPPIVEYHELHDHVFKARAPQPWTNETRSLLQQYIASPEERETAIQWYHPTSVLWMLALVHTPEGRFLLHGRWVEDEWVRCRWATQQLERVNRTGVSVPVAWTVYDSWLTAHCSPCRLEPACPFRIHAQPLSTLWQVLTNDSFFSR